MLVEKKWSHSRWPREHWTEVRLTDEALKEFIEETEAVLEDELNAEYVKFYGDSTGQNFGLPAIGIKLVAFVNENKSTLVTVEVYEVLK